MKSLRGAIKRNWRTFWSFLAPLIDVVIVLTSYVITSALNSQGGAFLTLITSYWRFAVFSLLLFLSINLARGLYRKFAFISFLRQLSHAGTSFVYTVGAVFSAYFLTVNTYYLREFLVEFFLMQAALYAAMWYGLRRMLAAMGQRGYGRWRTLLVGPQDELRLVSRRIEAHPELGYDVKKVLDTPDRAVRHDALQFDLKEVEKAIIAHDIELVVFSSTRLDGAFDTLMMTCSQNRTMMRLVSAESDFLFLRARLRDFAGIALYTPPRPRFERVKRFVKRGMDVSGAILVLVLTSPFFLVVGILTKIESHGSVFFRQKRSLSDDHVPFDFYKFRTMRSNADEQKGDFDHLNESNGALFKLKDDPRLTRIGKLIRRHSIDELPQLINVLRGDMSLVGPRPLPIDDFKRISSHDHMGGYFRQRARVKPGMTGLWQVSGRSDLGFREMVLLDLYYIENQSIIFDLEILIRTIPVILFGKGAY